MHAEEFFLSCGQLVWTLKQCTDPEGNAAAKRGTEKEGKTMKGNERAWGNSACVHTHSSTLFPEYGHFLLFCVCECLVLPEEQSVSLFIPAERIDLDDN